jgi:Cof subfamily protein (haloacid dehalogenase superfamily)
MNSHWKILACDLDGTLIGWDRKINERDLEALKQARDAGIHVAICTGRNSRESTRVTGALGLTGLGVFVNGAMVCDMGTGAAVDSQIIDEGAVDEAIAFFGARGHPVLVLVDDPVTRMPEYYLTDHGPAHRATTDWLLVNRVQSTRVECVPAQARGRIVRLGVVVDVAKSEPLHGELQRTFAGRATTHSIYSPAYNCQIIEFFRPSANKWTGLEHLAGVMKVAPEAVIAVGDDVNDIAMLRGARLSFAMGDAKPEVRAHAKRVTASQADCGLALVIDQLLAGELEP